LELNVIRPTIKGYFISHYIVIAILSLLLVLAGFSIILKVIGSDSSLGFLLIAIGLVLTISALAHCKIHRDVTSVYFNEDKLVYETGIFNHHKKKIPVHMITDSSLNRSFIGKMFNIATLNISTSGRSGYEISCDGLDYLETERMHDLLYENIKRYRTENVAKGTLPEKNGD